MSQSAMPSGIEVFYKLRTQRMQEVRIGITLNQPGVDSDDALANIQNEGDVDIAFDPANEKYDLFYRSVNESGVGNVVAIKRTTIRTTLSGAINATSTSFTLVAPSNAASFKVGDIIEIENELMVLLTWNTGTGAATVEERGAHGTTAASHADTTAVALMKYTVPHNSIVLAGNLDNVLPLAPVSFVLTNVVGAIGNGISMAIELPTSQIKSLFRVHIQTSTILWPEDFENLTGLIGTQASGSDGAITQGGNTLTTSVTLNTGFAGKLIHTHESINLTTGEVSAPDILRINTVVDNGDGTWTVNIIGDNVFNLRRGVVGTAGVVNWVIVDDFRTPGNPSTWVEQVKPFFNQGAGVGDPDVVDVSHILFTAETVYARCRLRNFEGYGPWMYWDGTNGSTSRAAAVTFTPSHINTNAIEPGAVTAITQSKGTIPATVDINMQSVDNDTVSWSAGNAAWADDTTESITAVGSPKTLSAPGIHYVFKITGNSTLQFTTTFSTAVGNDRTYLGQVVTTVTVGEFATVFLFGDINGPIFTAAVGSFGKLSALTADLGSITAGSMNAVTVDASTVTGGTVRTASSGHRIELTAAAQHLRFFNNAGSNVGSIDFEEATGRMIFNALGNDMRLLTTSGGTVTIFGGGIGNIIVASSGVDIFTLLDLNGVNINDAGNIFCDRIDKQGGGANVIMGDGIDNNGQNIINVGNLELDSITKDGAGNILFNDIIDMGGRNILNIGNLECDSLTKDGAGNIAVNSILDMTEKDIVNVGAIFLDGIKADVTTIQVFNNFEPAGTPNLGGSSARWNCFFATINVSSTTTFGSLGYNWPSTRSAGQQLQTDGGAGLTWAAAGSLRKDKRMIKLLSTVKALKKLLGAPVYTFKYKEGKGTGTDDLYAGAMADEFSEVMHHNGAIFSPLSGFGYLLAGVQELNKRLERLEIAIQ